MSCALPQSLAFIPHLCPWSLGFGLSSFPCLSLLLVFLVAAFVPDGLYDRLYLSESGPESQEESKSLCMHAISGVTRTMAPHNLWVTAPYLQKSWPRLRRGGLPQRANVHASHGHSGQSNALCLGSGATRLAVAQQQHALPAKPLLQQPAGVSQRVQTDHCPKQEGRGRGVRLFHAPLHENARNALESSSSAAAAAAMAAAER